MDSQHQNTTGWAVARLVVSGVLALPLLVLSFLYFDLLVYENSGRDETGMGGIGLMILLGLMLLNAVPICILTIINIVKNMYTVASQLLFYLCALVVAAGIISIVVWS